MKWKPLITDSLAASASDAVGQSYVEIRARLGDDAGLEFLTEVIGSAASLASGQTDTLPSDILRDIALGIDGDLSPIVREQANA